ncbi:endonuclease-reverse transcriptase [Elysia marginata]|uniref:Endonuclease-reverse transcriptase n=1 Tax=Elysia marginata TaxID=1093978 RepID=A0AAV4EW51_9GAST|nr:endonuclease-reverse transcriptase [Elysia marginata]
MLKKEIQMKLRRDKNSWLEQECAKISKWNEKRKSKELFDQVKSIQSKKFSPKNLCINDVNGQALTEPDKVLKRWNSYGTHLFGYPNKKETKDTYKVAQQGVEPESLTSEVEAAIKDLKAGKSPGLDNIPAEIIKNSGEMGIKALHHLFCQIWKQQEWPEDWKLQEFVMLYKNGNSKECGNSRTIALISHASKILLIIILNRMKCKVEEELSDCQAGYRANRGMTDMLLQIIIVKKKEMEMKKDI